MRRKRCGINGDNVWVDDCHDFSILHVHDVWIEYGHEGRNLVLVNSSRRSRWHGKNRRRTSAALRKAQREPTGALSFSRPAPNDQGSFSVSVVRVRFLLEIESCGRCCFGVCACVIVWSGKRRERRLTVTTAPSSQGRIGRKTLVVAASAMTTAHRSIDSLG